MSPTAVNIGPTAVDYSCVPGLRPLPTNESKLLRKWKQQDLQQFYREQASNRYSAR